MPELLPFRPAQAKLDFSTSFSSSNTLGHQLSHTGPQGTKDEDLPGVYGVSCVKCQGTYFGETGHTV